jgi:hypothetical protein
VSMAQDKSAPVYRSNCIIHAATRAQPKTQLAACATPKSSYASSFHVMSVSLCLATTMRNLIKVCIYRNRMTGIDSPSAP